jgi:pimeloyl-ACP methyl ester carboxylesterase
MAAILRKSITGPAEKAIAAGRYRIIVPDLRGIGLSVTNGHYDAPTIACDPYENLKAEGIGQVYVLDHEYIWQYRIRFCRKFILGKITRERAFVWHKVGICLVCLSQWRLQTIQFLF